MNRDWKSERGREERREARRRARAMNSSPCSKETKCWKEKGDKQRWRERKGEKKDDLIQEDASTTRKVMKNIKKKEEKKRGERMRGQLGLIWGNQPLRSRLPHTASYEIGNLGPSFTHKYKGRTERHAHTRSCVRGACWKAPGVYKFTGSNPLRRRIIAEGYISQQRNALIRRVWSLPRLCVCLFLGWVHD